MAGLTDILNYGFLDKFSVKTVVPIITFINFLVFIIWS
jgi:hypothetical protein